MDGSDDDQIHCFRQPCAAGKALLQAEMTQLMSSTNQTDDTDPFASDDDIHEADKNEACIDEDDESDGIGDDEFSQQCSEV